MPKILFIDEKGYEVSLEKLSASTASSTDLSIPNDFELFYLQLDLLIIGFPQSGTTTINRWLRQHPEIFMINDEDNIFWAGHIHKRKLKNWWSIYAKGIERKKEEYKTKYGKYPERIVAALKDPLLAYSADVQEYMKWRVASDKYPAKIVFMARDPLSMILSWMHNGAPWIGHWGDDLNFTVGDIPQFIINSKQIFTDATVFLFDRTARARNMLEEEEREIIDNSFVGRVLDTYIENFKTEIVSAGFESESDNEDVRFATGESALERIFILIFFFLRVTEGTFSLFDFVKAPTAESALTYLGIVLTGIGFLSNDEDKVFANAIDMPGIPDNIEHIDENPLNKDIPAPPPETNPGFATIFKSDKIKPLADILFPTPKSWGTFRGALMQAAQKNAIFCFKLSCFLLRE